MGVFDSIGRVGAGALSLGGTAYDYLTPGRGTNRVTKAAYDTFAPKAPSSPARQPASGFSTWGTGTGSSGGAYDLEAIFRKYGIGSSSPAPVYAPAIDLAGINARSRQQASEAVNPYYTKRLNDFLAEQAFKKDVKNKQTGMDITSLEDQLKQALETSQITGTRTTEDTARNVGKLNTQEDEFQTDSGSEFDIERIAQARVKAQSGLTGGIGSQGEEGAQAKRNTGEKRQVREFEQGREEQIIGKARTFEDLARSDVQASSTKEKGVTQQKFDLDNFIKSTDFETTEKSAGIEEMRMKAQADKEREYNQIAVNNFIASIANPAQRDAARRAYGGIY